MVKRQHLIVEIADHDALMPGVVVIRRVDSHSASRLAVFAEGDARIHGDFFELAVPHVAVQLVGLRVVGHYQVGPAVVVVVEHGHAERF